MKIFLFLVNQFHTGVFFHDKSLVDYLFYLVSVKQRGIISGGGIFFLPEDRLHLSLFIFRRAKKMEDECLKME